MKADVRAKQNRATLDVEEASLRARLLKILPHVASAGAQLFLNAVNSPKSTARYCHEEADDLFASAQRCADLRELLSLEGEPSIAGYFLAACHEAASTDPHRRGPRKLAEWLLTKVTS